MRGALRTTIIAVALMASARTARTQDVPNRESAIEVRKQFLADLDTLQARFLALADAFPAEKYSWRPGNDTTVRSVGEVFNHVASEYYVYTPMAYGAARSSVIQQGRANMVAFEKMSSKAQAQQHLKEGFAYMKQQLNALDAPQITGTKKLFGGDHTIIETSLIMSGDLHEHLGQLIAYARANGIKPPWSQ